MKEKSNLDMLKKRKDLLNNMKKRNLMIEKLKESASRNRSTTRNEKNIKLKHIEADRQEQIYLTKLVIMLF